MVVCAHCTCMAGLGEACSHIAALLFTVKANTQVKKRTACTSLPCSWLPPTFCSVPYAQLSDIDFSTPQQKRKKNDINSSTSGGECSKAANVSTLTPSPEELLLFTQISLRLGSLCYSLFCQSFVSHMYLCVWEVSSLHHWQICLMKATLICPILISLINVMKYTVAIFYLTRASKKYWKETQVYIMVSAMIWQSDNNWSQQCTLTTQPSQS